MEDRQYFSLLMSLAVLEANFGREDTKLVQEGEAGKIAQRFRGANAEENSRHQNNKTLICSMDLQWWKQFISYICIRKQIIARKNCIEIYP